MTHALPSCPLHGGMSMQLGETVWPWLATRAEQPLDDLMALVEPLQAIGLWRLIERLEICLGRISGKSY
jgi:hypothetical protein